MAAGASKRMKSIKQLLPWKSSNLLLETIKTLKASDATSINVILGANAEKILTQCSLEAQEVKWMVNPDWSLGLGKSIAFSVKKIMESSPIPDGVLICLADQPMMTVEHLNSLINAFRRGESKIIATRYKNRAGVPALFPASVYPNLLLLEGDQGAKEILEGSHHAVLLLNADGQLIDIDTKEEYQQLKQTNFQK